MWSPGPAVARHAPYCNTAAIALIGDICFNIAPRRTHDQRIILIFALPVPRHREILPRAPPMANASEVVPSALGVAEPPDITDAKPIAPEEKAWSSINIAGTEMVGARDAGVPESGQSSWGSERASNDSDTHFFDDRERGSLRGKDIPRLHCDEDGWVQRTCELLHQYGYVILTLPPDEASLVHDMYDAALDAFDSQTARHQLGVYERDRPRLDGRSGYMSDREREFFELHDRVPHDLETRAEAPRASHLLDVCTRYSSACRKRCYAILEALSGGPDTPLGRYMAAEAAGASGDVRLVGYKSSMMRVYQYDLAPPRVSDFRDDGDPHHDMGLLTLIPRSTFSGLDVQVCHLPESPRISLSMAFSHAPRPVRYSTPSCRPQPAGSKSSARCVIAMRSYSGGFPSHASPGSLPSITGSSYSTSTGSPRRTSYAPRCASSSLPRPASSRRTSRTTTTLFATPARMTSTPTAMSSSASDAWSAARRRMRRGMMIPSITRLGGGAHRRRSAVSTATRACWSGSGRARRTGARPSSSGEAASGAELFAATRTSGRTSRVGLEICTTLAVGKGAAVPEGRPSRAAARRPVYSGAELFAATSTSRVGLET